MLSVRLPSELEDQLEYLSMSSGFSKNTIVATALAEHLKICELGGIPLAQAVSENAHDTFVYRQKGRAAQYKNAHQIADWIRRNAIWTMNPENGRSDSTTPGIHGRNVVVGFSDSFDDNLYVISRHISQPQSYGTDRFHLYITGFDDWIECMIEVTTKPG